MLIGPSSISVVFVLLLRNMLGFGLERLTHGYRLSARTCGETPPEIHMTFKKLELSGVVQFVVVSTLTTFFGDGIMILHAEEHGCTYWCWIIWLCSTTVPPPSLVQDLDLVF